MNQIMNSLLSKDINQIIKVFTSALNSLHDLIYIMKVQKEEFIYAFVNHEAMTNLNIEKSIIGKTLGEVLPKETASFLYQQYLRAVQSREVVRYEDELVLPNGKKKIGETVITPFFEKDNIYVIGVVREVTERTKRERELEQSKKQLIENEQRLSSLVDYNEDAVFSFNTEGYFLEANDSSEKISGYSNGELIGTNFAALIPEGELNKVRNYYRQALQGTTVRYETVIYHKDGSEVYLSVTNIPIMINEHIKGVYGIAKDITSQIKAIEELNIMKSRMESFIKDSTDSIFILEANRKIEYINHTFSDFFGFTADELIGKELPTIPSWLISETDNLYEKVLSGENMQSIEVERQKKSGELVDVSLSLSPIYNALGKIVGISGICRDVTEKKKRELELRKQMEELELISTHTTNPVFVIGQNGAIIDSNHAFEELFGWNGKELGDMIPPPILLDFHMKQYEGFLTRIRQGEMICDLVTERRRKDGAIIDVIADYRPINKGNILAVATYKNVTQLRKAINELKADEEKYRNVVEASPEPCLLQSRGKITFINKAGLQLLKAKEQDQVIGKSLNSFVHPDDVYEEANCNESVLPKTEQEIVEKRILTLEGNTIFTKTTMVPLLESGITSFLVMIRDVTEQKRAEKSLQESEERFRIIAEYSVDIIIILDAYGTIIYASPSYERVLGYPVRNLIGKSFIKRINPYDVEAFQEKFFNMTKTKERMEIELRRKDIDGHSIWLHTDIIPVTSEEGEIEKYVVIAGDISEKKSKEKELTKMAYYDHLTGLPNRRLFNDRLQQAMYSTDRSGKLTALLVIDCDKFKQINDTFGHDIGDEVIKEFSNRINRGLRKTDTLSRVGGDEFTVVLSDIQNKQEVKEVTNRIFHLVREPMLIKGNVFQITASIGVSFYPSNSQNTEQLLKAADEALYKAKDLGGDTLSF